MDTWVVDFPGPDDDSHVHVLFKDKEGDGKNMTATSMEPDGSADRRLMRIESGAV